MIASQTDVKRENVRVPPPQHTQIVSLELMVASVSRVSRESDVGGHNDRDSDGRKRTVLRMHVTVFHSDDHDARVSSGPEYDHQLAVEVARLPNRDAKLASCSQNIN